MIISASYRTDIPAFYADWFLNRFRAGMCTVRNPYGGPPSEIALQGPLVTGFVFWTRNLGPFFGALREVDRAGYPFYVQYTVTGYPRVLEAAVPPVSQAVRQFGRLSEEFGPGRVVWRYDPILFSSETPRAFHATQFQRLADRFSKWVSEVVVSFTQIYRKTDRNLRRAAEAAGLTWEDPASRVKRDLLAELGAMARDRALKLTVCGQPELAGGAVGETRCIDLDRLSQLAGHPLEAAQKPHRKSCGCYQSRDIGAYDTCPHGCVYCYAVSDRASALRRYKIHSVLASALGDGAPPSEK